MGFKSLIKRLGEFKGHKKGEEKNETNNLAALKLMFWLLDSRRTNVLTKDILTHYYPEKSILKISKILEEEIEKKDLPNGLKRLNFRSFLFFG